MILLGLALALAAYAYAGYPLLLLWSTRAHRRDYPPPPETWPSISIVLPVHNGEAHLAEALEHLLAEPYPGERQILVISDGSTDRTVAIARSFAPRGVEVFELAERVGKTEGENRALPLLRGELVLNTDVAVRVHPGAVSALVAAMVDPEVGVASSCDISVQGSETGAEGESVYVGYEMWIRSLETALGGIVGASGSLYAIRATLHRRILPAWLSRDFSAALQARAAGYRAVSVPGALCYVPRGRSGRPEYRRKVRTMARGLATLRYHWRLLDPFAYGRFAWMLISHKLLRWLTPLTLLVAAAGMLLPVSGSVLTRVLVLGGASLAALGWWWPGRVPPRLLAFPAYAAGAVVAGAHAWWIVAARGSAPPTWEPTPRLVTTLRDGPASRERSAP